MATLIYSLRPQIFRPPRRSFSPNLSVKADRIAGIRWITVPARRNHDAPRIQALGRFRHPAHTYPYASPFSAPNTLAITPGYSFILRQSLASGSHQRRLRRCYSDSRHNPQKDPNEKESPFVVTIELYVAGAAIGIAAIYYFFHLERVPQTGRWRFMGIPPQVEAELVKDEHTQLLKEYGGRILPPDHPITQQIRVVVSAILEANELGVLSNTSVPTQGQKGSTSQTADVEIWDPDAERAVTDFVADDKSLSDPYIGGAHREWNLIVVHDDSIVNAMAGSGNIIVFTGILPVAYDMNGLAAVLSHEIAHVVARHVSEKLSKTLLLNAVYYILYFLGYDVGFLPVIMKYLYHLPNSRIQELEADKIGLQLASRACFDPRGAVSMQTRLETLERRGGASRLNLSVLQTHPTGRARIKLLTDSLPEAYALRAASPACAQLEDDFDAFKAMAKDVGEEQRREVSSR
ncbi:uncharacterized protein FOMMEDRAFT_159294 [Fomitiporia mediterranea MF3/22]|uniref:uncharacterized protein n=1 Tax=Fomitiporia mediterranea (strain MF3/22) TaxID=694068 RepID=UPI00044093D7|nr:uncharacterized protein FOMMEDRAFT_159294 [Fomitiporia mediterranea MF3/22]EJD00558.1 hypothetical protein FOMMEDRAFT_159294 [Fomitiporia mediterranea MF3/22]